MPTEAPLRSSQFEYQGYWKLDERIKTICLDRSGPAFETLINLVRLIRIFGPISDQLDIAEKNLEQRRDSLAHLGQIIMYSHDAVEDQLEYDSAVATDQFVETHDQIRGYFQELGLRWYLRDQVSSLYFLKPSTIFASAMQHIEDACKSFEV